MAATIKIKNSSTTGSAPSAGSLVQGELAVNVTDQGLYTKNASGTVVKLNAPSIDDKNTGATKYLTIDTSGNLGLGVTPSAWTTVTPVIQVGTGSSIYGYGTEARLNTNLYYDGAFKYRANGYASSLNLADGGFKFFTASSGSANASFSFTQAMTLDASGNLGVGTTSPAARLDVANPVVGITYPLFLTNTSATNNGRGVGMKFTNGSGSIGEILGWYDGTDQTLVLTATGSMRFNAGGAERARIDSSGKFIITATKASDYAFSLTNTATSASGLKVAVSPAANSTDSAFDFYANSVATLLITTNGNIKNTNNSYGAISDIKLKENIVDATPKLAQLNQVRVVNYNLKTDPEHKQLGVVAQELEQVFPSMVEESPDRDAEGNDLGTTTKSVKYSVFVPMLIKAIQEQQALITQLQADVAALKA